MRIFRKKAKAPGQNPRHIAIIMDGNGRYARARGLPRSAGHAAGAENFRRISEYCEKKGMEQLTVYAFSTENWRRSPEEVNGIMQLLRKYLKESCETIAKKTARLRFMGNLSVLPDDIRRLIEKTEQMSANHTGMTVNVCVNYGGREEILNAAAAYARDVLAGKEDLDALDEATFSKRMYFANQPDPDLIIRTGGESRLSNFLLWQAAYSEIYVTDTLWPEFSHAKLNAAIDWYKGRERRYGGVIKGNEK
jgi:undecaprenyl diphosphate synthase